jgi:EmrB/QacA subfamily drug resistance transporter
MSSVIHASCDVALASSAPQGVSEHPRLVLVTTILASSLAFVDGSVVNVGLPAIAHSFHATAADLQWTINAYLLPLSALLLLGGAVGDRFGRRRVLIFGVTVFALASAACAAAPSLDFLLLARVIQGVGAAMLLPNSLATLGGAFSGPARGRAIGTWAAAGAIAGAIGPVAGGWLIDVVGWRAIFLLNPPLAAAAVLLAWRFVEHDRNSDRSPLDVTGGFLATLGLGSLAWGLTIGVGPGGWSALAVALMVGGSGLCAAFVIEERRLGDRAMMPLALFASKTFVGLTLLTVLLYGALGGLLVLMPYELIQAGGYSAAAAGAALAPFPLVMALASPISGAVAGRFGARWPLVGGSALVAAGLLLATRIGPDASYWTTVLPPILVIALGMAGAAAPLTTAVLNSVDARHTASASGFNSAAARTGGLVATALLGSVLAASGARLTADFRVAAVSGALVCLAAAASGFALIRRGA